MKQKIYLLGMITVMITVLGVMFKVSHYPGAAILLVTGVTVMVMVFIPTALRNHFKSEEAGHNLSLYIVTWLTCLVVFAGMLFKILHWPLAGYLMIIALPFPYVVFLPVFLTVTGRNKNFDINNTVYILFLLSAISVISLLLALNVSK